MFWGCPSLALGQMQIINPISFPPGRPKCHYFDFLIFLGKLRVAIDFRAPDQHGTRVSGEWLLFSLFVSTPLTPLPYGHDVSEELRA